jgi:hypothetical protein
MKASTILIGSGIAVAVVVVGYMVYQKSPVANDSFIPITGSEARLSRNMINTVSQTGTNVAIAQYMNNRAATEQPNP